jgi:Bax protein
MLSGLVLGAGLTVGASALGSAIVPPVPEQPIVLAAGSMHYLGYRGLDQVMSANGYTLAAVRRGGGLVPRVFAEAMPPDMDAIATADERKRIFIKVMLPLVLEVNEHLMVDRAHLIYLMTLKSHGLALALADRRWLDGMYTLFEVAPGDDVELLRRVDVIPPSLALAQAAQETGWGTSRFVHEGNALFGERVWDDDGGMVPSGRAEGQTHTVRSFDGLKSSVLAYMVNLNRHPAYDGFRHLRAMQRRMDRPLDPALLAGGLGGYSEEGRDYIAKIRAIIRANGLTDFDNARLTDVRT